MERRQSCASRLRRGRARKARHKSLASVGVSPPNFFRSFHSLPSVIRAEAAPCECFHRHLLLQLSMDHRVKPDGDESRSGVTVAWHSSGRKGAPRERVVIASAAKWREAIQSEAPLWIASSLTLLAMTTPLPTLPHKGGGKIREARRESETMTGGRKHE